jgi:transposase
VPAVEAWAIEPIWVQFEALLPPHLETHPWGCHNPRIPDRVVFDKLVAKLVFGGSYAKHADATCSATTIRNRRDEWIAAGTLHRLEQIVLAAYDQIIGLDLADVSVDGQITKAPCGGEAAGKSPVDRGKLGIKWSRLTDGKGIPLGCVVAAANRNDSPLLRPTLERLGRFELALPEQMTVHLDAGYDSKITRELLDELGCEWQIQPKGEVIAINHTRRWVVERTNSWYSRGFNFTAICTERRVAVINALLALTTAIIVIRRLIREAWTTHRWDTRPRRRP